jgi:hypothetical protein
MSRKRGPIVSVVTVVIVASLALSPTAARAQRTHEGVSGGRGIVSGLVGARPIAHHPFDDHRFAHRPFSPFGGIAVYAPPVWGGPSAYYDPAPEYAPPVVYSVPPDGTVSVALAPPPMPSVVPYPTGRYELRGDGITIPLQWVWIPNPPSAPPTGPSAGSPTPSGAPPADPPAPHQSRLYRWIDAQGVVNWTNNWEAVPEQYRSQTKRTQPS